MLFHQKYLVKVFICLASLNHLEFFSFDYLTHNNIILNFSLFKTPNLLELILFKKFLEKFYFTLVMHYLIFFSNIL